MATHQALPYIPYFPTADNWHLMIDECLQVDRCQDHDVRKTHNFITEHIGIDQFNSIYGRVKVTNLEEMEKLARNPDGDELLDKLRETAGILINPHWRSYVNIEQYNKLIHGKVNKLTFHSLLQSTIINGFASVFMAGANLEDSGVYNLWGQEGIRFKEDREFTEGLRFETHPNGHLLTIYYAVEKDWSRDIRTATIDGVPNQDRMRDAVKCLFGSSPFLWQANKRVSDSFIDGGTRLPHNSLGLNGFSDVHDIAFFSSLNPSSPHIRFLKDRGLTSEQISRMGYCSTVYQAVMRTSLRDRDNQAPKRIVVPDLRAAQFLREKFPGASLRKLKTGIVETVGTIGRPRTHANNAEKSRRRRELEKEQRRKMLSDMMAFQKPQDYYPNGGCQPKDRPKQRTESPIELITHFDTQLAYFGTIYSHKKSSEPESFLYCADQASFIHCMEIFHQQSRDSKEANSLISPAIFDPDRIVYGKNGKRTRRAKDNIVYVQNIMLDFEEGDLTPEGIAGLFPDLQMIVTNSYRHTADKPRFRVIILTTRHITPDVSEALFDAIVQKLQDAGYVKAPRAGLNYATSGLDFKKRTATSLFYLPCQAKVASDSFFNVYAEPGRKPLAPDIWIKNARLSVQDDVEDATLQPAAQGEYDQARLDAAVAKWRLSASHPGEGNHQFFLFAVELKKMGMSTIEITAKLKAEAQFGRSPLKRIQSDTRNYD